MILTRVAVAAALCILGLAAAPASPPTPGAPGTPGAPAADDDWKTRSIFTIETRTLEDQPAKLSTYSGKVALVVNLASKCGYTPQYEGLENLYKEFKDKGLVILGFPCNDFGGQEPGTPQEIRDFCTSKYHVTFPLFAKISVKSGDDQSTMYTALEAKTGKLPKWNFGKYVVSRDGKQAEFFDSKVAPDSKDLRQAIEHALAAK